MCPYNVKDRKTKEYAANACIDAGIRKHAISERDALAFPIYRHPAQSADIYIYTYTRARSAGILARSAKRKALHTQARSAGILDTQRKALTYTSANILYVYA